MRRFSTLRRVDRRHREAFNMTAEYMQGMTRPYRLFLNSGLWKNLRARYRGLHPFCERCGKRPSTLTHHKQPCGDDVALQTTWSNLEALFSRCHAEHHAPEKAAMRRGYSTATDIDGYPTDARHIANRPRRQTQNPGVGFHATGVALGTVWGSVAERLS